MSSTKELLTVDFHDDDDTGMYEIGEVDYGIHSCELYQYLKQFGLDGMNNVVSVLGHLIYEVKKQYLEIANEREMSRSGAKVVNKDDINKSGAKVL